MHCTAAVFVATPPRLVDAVGTHSRPRTSRASRATRPPGPEAMKTFKPARRCEFAHADGSQCSPDDKNAIDAYVEAEKRLPLKNLTASDVKLVIEAQKALRRVLVQGILNDWDSKACATFAHRKNRHVKMLEACRERNVPRRAAAGGEAPPTARVMEVRVLVRGTGRARDSTCTSWRRRPVHLRSTPHPRSLVCGERHRQG